MSHPLRDRRTLVTGGSRGIGAAIVKRLVRDGAHVALTYASRADQAEETVRAARAATQAAAKHMTSGGRIITIGSCNEPQGGHHEA